MWSFSLSVYLLNMFNFQEATEMSIIITRRENDRLHQIAIQLL